MVLYLSLMDRDQLDSSQYLMLQMVQLYPQEPIPRVVMKTTITLWDPW